MLMGKGQSLLIKSFNDIQTIWQNATHFVLEMYIND